MQSPSASVFSHTSRRLFFAGAVSRVRRASISPCQGNPKLGSLVFSVHSTNTSSLSPIQSPMVGPKRSRGKRRPDRSPSPLRHSAPAPGAAPNLRLRHCRSLPAVALPAARRFHAASVCFLVARLGLVKIGVRRRLFVLLLLSFALQFGARQPVRARHAMVVAQEPHLSEFIRVYPRLIAFFSSLTIP
jgi:hypothetical protein